MQKVPQICSICRREFGRKSNARRHNESLHSSQALILPKFGSYYDLSQDARFRSRGLFSTTGKSPDELLLDVLERIGSDIEACEQEIRLVTSSEKEISKMLAPIITQSLQSPDPKQTAKSYLRVFRRTNLLINATRQIVAGLELSPPLARQYLLNCIKKT